MSTNNPQIEFEVYLLQAEEDVDWVEQHLAQRLVDDEQIQPYFFKWQSIPGASIQGTMLDGFNRSGSCAVCLGANGLGGLGKLMQERAIERQANTHYPLIPVILPGGAPSATPQFLQGIPHVDFRDPKDFDWQFHLLVCGIRAKAPGARPVKKPTTQQQSEGSEVSREPFQATFVAIVKTINAAEKEGLPKEEATDFRRRAFENIQQKMTEVYMEQINNKSSRDEVTAQESRTTD